MSDLTNDIPGTAPHTNGIRETVDFSISNTVRFYRNVNSDCFLPHWHLPGEIIAPLENSYEVIVAGDTLELQPGDVLIISPGELHAINAPPTGVRYILNYDPEQLEQIQDIVFLFSMLRPYHLLRGMEFPDLTSRLLWLLQKIEEEYGSDAPYREGAIFAFLINFFVELGRQAISEEKFQGSTQSKQQEYTEQFIGVCNYISKHCTENLTLETVAEHAGFSKYHFSRLFKKFVNTTFHEYLTSSRILWAKKLLVDSSISITEISMRSGFNSLATFNRIFKNELGCTPSEYRKLNVSSSKNQE